MKSLFIASALALGSTLALAQTSPSTSQQRAATPSAANSQLGEHASDYWGKTAKDGHMTRDQAMGYTTPDGKPYARDGKSMQFDKVDTDGDGRVSQKEWMGYHGSTGGMTTGPGATGSGTTPRAGGADSGSTAPPRN